MVSPWYSSDSCSKIHCFATILTAEDIFYLYLWQTGMSHLEVTWYNLHGMILNMSPPTPASVFQGSLSLWRQLRENSVFRVPQKLIYRCRGYGQVNLCSNTWKFLVGIYQWWKVHVINSVQFWVTLLEYFYLCIILLFSSTSYTCSPLYFSVKYWTFYSSAKE